MYNEPKFHMTEMTMDSTSAYPTVSGYITGDYTNLIGTSDHTINLKQYDTITPIGVRTDDYVSPFSIIDTSTHSGDMTIYGDLTVQGKIKTSDGEISKVDLDENDAILLTVDPEQYDAELCMNILKTWQRAFPNHKVVMSVKGVKINFINEKGGKRNEVVW